MPTPAALFREFLRLEAAGGILLVIATVLALVIANSAAAPLYDAALALPLTVKAGGFGVDKPLLLWINDGLMAVFFLVVGLEIKREVMEGELSSPAQASLPVIAAVGGMAVPALVYLAFNADSPATLKGWAIPAATDIAFALGVLSLLGPRVPLSLKVFLTALAIIDDLGAIIIIAVFYTASLSQEMLALAGAAMAALIACNLLGVRRIGWYLGIGTLLWLFVLKSGVHATLAGVALALTIPLKADGGGHSPAHALEHRLHGPVAYAILPVFAFANAGVPLGGIGLADVLAPLPLGVALGLFLGKQVGVFAFTWAAIRLRLARLPERATWTQIYGVSVLTGIGFTMSLFIGGLAFDDAEHAAGVRIGVLAGSLLSAVAGYALLRLAAGTATASGTAEATPDT